MWSLTPLCPGVTHSTGCCPEIKRTQNIWDIEEPKSQEEEASKSNLFSHESTDRTASFFLSLDISIVTDRRAAADDLALVICKDLNFNVVWGVYLQLEFTPRDQVSRKKKL